MYGERGLPVAFFHFFHEFIDVEVASHGQDQLFDLILAAIDIE